MKLQSDKIKYIATASKQFSWIFKLNDNFDCVFEVLMTFKQILREFLQ